jgi:hypothetical protein
MTKKNGVNHSMQLSVVARRKRVIERLENQLKKGLKCKGPKCDNEILFDFDIRRIEKEIATLKTRLL